MLSAFMAQGVGASIGSILLVALGIGLEIWFWVRVADKRHHKKNQ